MRMNKKMKKSMKQMVAIFLCAALLLGLAGCGHGPQEIQFVTVEDGTIQREQTAPMADFSYELLRQTAAREKQAVLVSPISAWLALSMTGQGAAGDTAQAFQSFFQGLEADEQRVLAAWMMQALAQQEQLQMANSIWCDDGLTVQDSFLETTQQYYRAEVRTVDLQAAGAVKTINTWIADHTQQRILDMLQEIDRSAVMLLVNALALDAQWAEPFEPNATYEQPFYGADGAEQQLAYLHRRCEQAPYLQWPQGQGLVLPYQGDDLVMVVLKPAADSDCGHLLEQLSAAWMEQLLADSQTCTVQLALPKFEMNSQLNLNAICGAMGLEIAFDPQRADFSSMADCSDGNLFIGQILQNCALKVDEAGTEAAAATVVEMRAEGAMLDEEEIIELEFDRPFVYLVLERQTQIPLFAGIYQGEAAR